MNEESRKSAREIVERIRKDLQELVLVYKQNAGIKGNDSSDMHLLRQATAQNSLMDISSGLDGIIATLTLEDGEYDELMNSFGTSLKSIATSQLQEALGKMKFDETVTKLTGHLTKLSQKEQVNELDDLMNVLNKRRGSTLF